MNVKIVLLSLLLISNLLRGQDETYKGPAKIYVTNFYKQAAEGKSAFEKGNNIAAKNKAEQMEKSLSQVKTKDPSYNIAAMELELLTLKNNIENRNNDKASAEKKAEEEKIKANSYNGYNGPAVGNVKAFWQYVSPSIENMSETDLNVAIGGMQNSLSRTKEKDPSYNTSEMENTLEKYKAKRKELQIAEANKYTGDKVKDAQKKESISDDPGKLFKELFEDEGMQTGAGSSSGEKWKAKLEKYNEKVNKLLSMDYSDVKVSHTKMSKGSINSLKTKTDKTLGEIDEMLSKYTDKESMEVGFYTIQFQLAYWDAASKVFSEETSYKEMYNKVKSAADKMGSLESMKTKADDNNQEYIKNTKLPSPVIKDAKLEKILTDGFNKKFGAEYKVSALKAVLTQEGWTTIRNPITSVITGREKSAKVAYKGSDGKCYIFIDYVFIHEEYIGGAFTNTKAVYKGLDGKEMLCGNVE